MDCPICQADNPSVQKFCGACGHKLEVNCVRCGTPNPPHYKFCGQCGSSLASVGTITLAKSGLISKINQKALDLFGHHKNDMQGKPFSLFIEREDLVIFFSHLNELHNSATQQSFEVKLRHADSKIIYALLECRVDVDSSEEADNIHMLLTEVTDHRLASAQLQYQQDLLALMFTVTDSINTVSRKHLGIAIEDALKKICLFAKADHSFIYGINNHLKLLEPAYRWQHPSPIGKYEHKRQSVPVKKLKRFITRLRQEQKYIIHDTTQLTASERQELRAWHQVDLGAMLCYLIYSENRYIAVVGLAKAAADGEWTPECQALVKFFGHIIADIMPIPYVKDPKNVNLNASSSPVEPQKKNSGTASKDNVIDISAKQPRLQSSINKQLISPTTAQQNEDPHKPRVPTRQMLLEKLSHRVTKDQQSVFPLDNDLVMLTCPRCSFQESVSVDQFKRLGQAIAVICQCQHHFSIVLEKRRSFRKSVQLEGYFSIKGDMGPIGSESSIWGPMVVKDLSKAGLRFSSQKADLIHVNDLLMVRFNLDNTNQALINKPARVLSINDNEVGCHFEGSDNYDITLGFYFI